MDLGDGSFVFSKGVASAIQLIKDPAYLTSTVTSKFIRATRKSLPIIVLGLICLILLKGIDYPVIYFYFRTCVKSSFLRSMKRSSMDDTGIFSSFWRFFLLFRFYFILFFPIALIGVVVGLSTNIVSYFILEDVLNEFPFRSRTCSS